jgi:hypothetical protein
VALIFKRANPNIYLLVGILLVLMILTIHK